jgi:hypothetical protein
MKGDERDLPIGEFLREVPGVVARSRTVQGFTESVCFGIFCSPSARLTLDTNLQVIRSRIRAEIATR